MKSIQSAWSTWLVPAVGSRVLRNSLYSVIGYGVPLVATIVFTPLLIRSMGTSEFGLWMLSLSFIGLLGFFDFGLSTAVSKHIAQYHGQGDLDRLSATATMGMLIYLTIGLVLAAPAYLLAPHAVALFQNKDVPNDVMAGVLRLAAIGFVPLLLRSASLAVPIGLQRFRVTMAMSILQSTLNLALALLISRRGGSVTQVVAGSLITLWVMAAVSILVGYRMLYALGAKVLISWAQARLMLKFSAFAGVSGLGSLLFGTVDRIAVGVTLGVSAVAYYSVAAGIAANLMIIAGVLTAPLMPAASSWSSSGQWERVRTYLARSTLAIAILELTLASLLLLISRPFLNLWLGTAFAASTLTTFRILIVVYAVASLNAPAYMLANGSGFPGVPALGAVLGGVLTVLLILVLAGAWGLKGAAWANTGYWATLLIPVLTARALKRRSSEASIITVNATSGRPSS